MVIIDTGWEDNLASGTTNSAGNCSVKVRTGYNIVVQTTYKDENNPAKKFGCKTFDNFGKRQRRDICYEDEGERMYYFNVDNCLTGKWYSFYAGDLPNYHWDESGDIEDKDYKAGLPLAESDQWLKSAGYIHRPDTVILGKTCSVWKEPAVNSFGIPTDQNIVYKWKRIELLHKRKGKITWQLSKITENVPEEAFSFTKTPYWIE